MRTFFFLWAAPLAFLGAWYFLSSNDLHYGIFFLTRETHDEVFSIYSNALGIPAELLPGLVLKAIIVDTLLVLAFIAFRRRQSWWPNFREWLDREVFLRVERAFRR